LFDAKSDFSRFEQDIISGNSHNRLSGIYGGFNIISLNLINKYNQRNKLKNRSFVKCFVIAIPFLGQSVAIQYLK